MSAASALRGFAVHVRTVFPYLLLLVFGLFMLGYFLFPDYSAHYKFFVRRVLPLGVFAAYASFATLRQHPLFPVILVYMGYLLLSGLWSDPMDWYRLGQRVMNSVYLLVFIMINLYLVTWNRALYERVLQVCVLIAAAAAFANIVVFYGEHGFPGTRMIGFGSLTNVNEFSNVYGIYALLAVMLALREESIARRLLFLGVIPVFIAFAWFGQSRMAFVAMVMALLVAAFLKSRHVRWYYALGLLLLVAVFFALFPKLLVMAIERGESLRLQIWAGLWPDIKASPFFGNGLAAMPSVTVLDVEMTTAHNAFIQVLWTSGIVGLSVFLYLLYALFKHAWRWGQETQNFVIFCMFLFAVSAMMTGVDTLINRTRDQWMLFWFPVALLIAYQSASVRSPARDSSA